MEGKLWAALLGSSHQKAHNLNLRVLGQQFLQQNKPFFSHHHGVWVQKNIKIQFCITTHNIRKHSASKAFHGNAVYYVHHTSLHIPRFFTQIGLGLRNMSLGCQQHTIPKVHFSSKIHLKGENVYIFWTKIGLLEHCATSANKKGSLFF